MKRHLDFDVLFRRTDTGYRAEVVSSPAGQASSDFGAPFSDLQLENFLLRIGRPRRATRRMSTTEMAATKAFGRGLFSAVFTGDVLACFRMSVEHARAQDAGLRIRLRLSEVPELADLPWEYLYNASQNSFLSLSAETSIVRFLDLPARVQPLHVELPIRVLVMVANPNDYPQLDVEAEWTKLKDALKGLEEEGRVILERLPNATLQALQWRLRGESCHVFHFIGHGGFNEQEGEGLLVLEGETGRADPVSSEYLGALLHDHRPLRVVVLNACEGARGGRTDPFAGTAQSLVQKGIPAVIAMQFEITDEAAVIFAHELYVCIAEGSTIDTALVEARKALFGQVSAPEWGTPVLYMRGSDGYMFDVTNAQKRDPALGLVPQRDGGDVVEAVPDVPLHPAMGSSTSPCVYISYSWDSVAHKQRVLELSSALRHAGIETHLDQYEVGPPSSQQWQHRQFAGGNFLLMVCTEGYLRRLQDEPGEGAHTYGNLICEQLAANSNHAWLMTVGFGRYRENRAAIPAFVGDAEYYDVAHSNGYARLLARLLGRKQLIAKPTSGEKAPNAPIRSELAILNDEIEEAEESLDTLLQKNDAARVRIKAREQQIQQRSLFFPLLIVVFVTLAFLFFVGFGVLDLGRSASSEGLVSIWLGLVVFGTPSLTLYVRAKILRGYRAQTRRCHEELAHLEARELNVRSRVETLRRARPS